MKNDIQAHDERWTHTRDVTQTAKLSYPAPRLDYLGTVLWAKVGTIYIFCWIAAGLKDEILARIEETKFELAVMATIRPNNFRLWL